MIMAVNINRASGSDARFGLVGKAAGTPAPTAKPRELAKPAAAIKALPRSSHS
jgi:hypothetical protein